jgi:DNA polymerase III alpha subunit (gram-positive type)
MSKDLCFIDVETTGSLFGYHEITELAAIRTTESARAVIDIYQVKIMPKHPERVTETAKQISNFGVDDWKDAVDSSNELWQKICLFWSDCIPVCHNPPFERAFITLAMTDVGNSSIGLDYHWIGTESLAWPLYVSGQIHKISLSTLLDYFDLPPEPLPHRAINGAMSCKGVYIKLMEMFEQVVLR